MFYRSVISNLKLWASQEDRKPLILRGARQVGKTTAVDIFAKEFDYYIYLNLETKEDAELFNRDIPLSDLTQAIYLHKKIAPAPGKRTLLFIDEIQNSPSAVSMMRYFYEEPGNLFVIGAGSLLEILIGSRQISFPVGRVTYLFMYPLTFEEFLGACGDDSAVQLFQQVPLPSFAHSHLLKLFHKYTLIGGMPEIVEKYVKKTDIISLKPYYQGLITAYLDDVAKYARTGGMIDIIRYAFETAPYEAGKRIKFQGFGQSNYKSREMGEALRTLEKAMLLYLLYPSTVTEPPLMENRKKSPKLQFLDTGIMNFAVGLQEYFFKHDDLHSFYQGTLAEHIVGQELMAADMVSSRKTTFWVKEQKQSNAEVDFLLPYKYFAIPLEVKAGKTGALRSLHQFVDQAPHPYAVRLSAAPLSVTETITPGGKPYKLLNLPYYLTGKIRQYLDWFIQ